MLYVENTLNEIQMAGGINTAKPVNLNGAILTGDATQVLTKTTASTLTAAQSGSLVVLNAAVGFTTTLPAPVVGLVYEFDVLTSVTSSSLKVITSGTGIYLHGAVVMGEASGAGTLNAVADGSSIVSIAMNGTTTGGLIGTVFTVTCVSLTEWAITGVVTGSGTLVTPFATS
jgi:hypothetical protein